MERFKLVLRIPKLLMNINYISVSVVEYVGTGLITRKPAGQKTDITPLSKQDLKHLKHKKMINRYLKFSFVLLLFNVNFSMAQVGIGTSTPNGSAQLDVTSTSRGFLPPRMTESARNAIASPTAGLIIWCSNCGNNGELQVFDGIAWKNLAGANAAPACGGTVPYNGVNYGTVTGAGGKCWLDRNLGASQVAQSPTDHSAYGALFQWGRGADGHQIINWTTYNTGTAGTTTTTSTRSTSDVPGNDIFITVSAGGDWRNPKNDNLWQGVNGINNVCPSGWRLPTIDEWDTERRSWSTQDIAGAFASPLKLTLAGIRSGSNGGVFQNGVGAYWSSTISSDYASYLYLNTSTPAYPNTAFRSVGHSVRCIKN